MNRNTTIVIALLVIVIILLTWLLIVKQVEAPTVQPSGATTTGLTVSTSPTPPPPASGALHDRIHVTFPAANASVSHTFTVTGKAPGNWFSEAQAPIMVQAEDGSKIAQGQMLAQGDWMTTDLVDFKADITINMAYTGPAILVLLKDNESGLPQNDDSLSIPITVK